jgi:oleate hydratase
MGRGGGIAALASAVYLEKDAGVPGVNIHILEKSKILGGALDGSGDAENGFVTRGGRIHELLYTCYWDLLSYIPSFTATLKDSTFHGSKCS